MIALLVWLLVFLFGLVETSLAPTSTAHSGTAVVVPVHRAAFTMNGRTVPGGGRQILLHKGDLLRFPAGVSELTVIRFACANDFHRIVLRHGTWRVPDLPTGEYALAVQGAASSEISVVSHDAPCPGA